MSTTIGRPSTGLDWIPPILLGVFMFFMLAVVAPSWQRQNEQAQAVKACSQFSQLPLKDVPARCVTPEGGFIGE